MHRFTIGVSLATLVVGLSALVELLPTARAQVNWVSDESPEAGPAAPTEASTRGAAEAKRKYGTPRATWRTFIAAMNRDDKDEAASCLDLSEFTATADVRRQKGREYAYKLKDVLDRLAPPTFEPRPIEAGTDEYALASDLASSRPPAPSAEALMAAEEIVIARGEDGCYRFSAATVEAIEPLWDVWSDRPSLATAGARRASKPFPIWLREQFPASMHGRHLILRDYQWVCLLGLIFVGSIVDLGLRFMLQQSTAAWLRLVENGQPAADDRHVWRPVGWLAQALIWYCGTALLDLPPIALTVLLTGLKFFAVVAGIWTAFRLIDMLTAQLTRSALRTETKYDDLLVPLIQKSLKAFVTCVGILVCAEAFNLPLAGLLGGLGLGGMAIAFASRDAVANFFGSITVLIDRPFEIGDSIKAAGIEGTVEVVGFRSTRLRTFYNSQITLPNSLLTTAIVDNMGRRKFRRMKETIGIEYGTAPEVVEAFCEGIRELIRRHPYTRKEDYHVYLNGLGASSLDLLVCCFMECPNWSMELRERHRLLMDIIRLAEQLNVSFAFPTQKQVVVHEDATRPRSDGPSLLEPTTTGQRAAARVAGPPIPHHLRPGPVEFPAPAHVDLDVYR